MAGAAVPSLGHRRVGHGSRRGAPPAKHIGWSRRRSGEAEENELSTSSTPYRLELPMPTRIVVLVSGSGTLLQALLDAGAADHDYPAKVVAVGADRTGISGLARAERA